MSMMKAARLHNYGGPETIAFEEVARPEPQAGEALVRVRAAAVNPVDWMIAGGYGKEWWEHQLPLTLGCEFAGVIEAAGAGVTRLKAGDEVYGYVSLRRCGAYAEYVIAREDEVVAKPSALDFTAAAAIPVGALTAWQALYDQAGLQPGGRVLIHAASGGVGSIAVQLAKANGAEVIGTASGRNADFVKSLGASEVIDYTAARFEEVVQDVDVVFDLIGGETQERSFNVLKPGGFLVSAVQPPSPELTAQHGVRSAMVTVLPNANQLQAITELVESGRLRPFIETVLPLSEVQAALKQSQTGRTRGKIVLQPKA